MAIDFPYFLILIPNFSAFYRVNYTAELWDALAVALLADDFSGIPELNRAQITDDVLEYAKYDKMTYTQAFTVIEFLENDESYFSWYAVNTELSTVFENVGLHTRLGQVMQVNKRTKQFVLCNRYFYVYLINIISEKSYKKSYSFQSHIVRFIDKLYNSAPASVINEDDQLYTLRQILATNLACKLHHQGCGADIKEHFTNFKDNGVM